MIPHPQCGTSISWHPLFPKSVQEITPMNHPVISKQDTPNKRFVYKALEQLHTRSIQLNWLSRTGGKQKSSYIFPCQLDSLGETHLPTR